MEKEPVKLEVDNLVSEPNKFTLESVEKSNSLELIKENLRRKYPIEDIFRSLGVREDAISADDKDLVEQRYENCLDCAAKIEELRGVYPEEIEKQELYGGRDYPLNIPGRVGLRDADKSSPFVGWGRIIGEHGMTAFEKTLQFKPDMIVPTISSAVLPAVMVKRFFEAYTHSRPDTKKPFFVLPRDASKGKKQGKELEDLKNKIKERWKPLDRKEFEIRDIERFGPLKEGESMDKLYENYLKFDQYGNLIESLKRFSTQEEVRVVILDEFISKGRSTQGLTQLVSVIFDSMKELGELPPGIELKIEILNLNNESLYGSSRGWLKGREREEEKMFSKFRGGALPVHNLRRKLFEIVGEHFAKEFEIVQELKKRESARWRRSGSEKDL